MPRHELELHSPSVLPVNRDWRVVVKSDGTKLGTLEFSKGSIDWRPGRSKTTRYTLSWEQFDRLMKDYGTQK